MLDPLKKKKSAHMLDQMTHLLILEIIYSFFSWLITFRKFSDSKGFFVGGEV